MEVWGWGWGGRKKKKRTEIGYLGCQSADYSGKEDKFYRETASPIQLRSFMFSRQARWNA